MPQLSPCFGEASHAAKMFFILAVSLLKVKELNLLPVSGSALFWFVKVKQMIGESSVVMNDNDNDYNDNDNNNNDDKAQLPRRESIEEKLT